MNNPLSHYRAFEIGSRWRIVPPGLPPSADGRVEIVIARGAFGSGEHDTTASCLEALEKAAIPPGARVLDFGCGTGVLAIAALKLGAGHAVCVDTAPAAVECTRDNLRRNGLAQRAELVCGGLEQVEAGAFDLVLANIYGDIILAAGGALLDRARPGGVLLLSGVLWEDNFAVRRLLEAHGCRVTANHMLELHSTITARR